jgi:hypothetical protein
MPRTTGRIEGRHNAPTLRILFLAVRILWGLHHTFYNHFVSSVLSNILPIKDRPYVLRHVTTVGRGVGFIFVCQRRTRNMRTERELLLSDV